LYNLAAATTWQPFAGPLYKWLDNRATHAPDSPWFALGRFGEGAHKTLYLAESPRGAIAEFLRMHPEFLQFQNDLNITVYEILTAVGCECLDVRREALSEAIGFPHERLASSERDEAVRYVECRALGAAVADSELCGIAYPSAGATWVTWNLVLFGDANQLGRWQVVSCRPVSRPTLSPSGVRALR